MLLHILVNIKCNVMEKQYQIEIKKILDELKKMDPKDFKISKIVSEIDGVEKVIYDCDDPDSVLPDLELEKDI